MSELGGFQSAPSEPAPETGDTASSGSLNVTGERLRSFIERVERMEEEKATLMEDIKEIFSEAKGEGFDVKIMRQIIRIRKMDVADRQEAEAILETYMAALGMA